MGWQDRPYNADGSYSGGLRFGFTPPTPMALGVMVACFAVFVLQALTGSHGVVHSPLVEWGELTFAGLRGFTQPWRWVTYQYLHHDGMHIFWNLLGIYFFLPSLERLWGWRKALIFYTLGGVAAGVVFGIVSLFTHPAPIIGASGSIFAALGACALLFPEKQVLLLVFPVPIRLLAILLAVLWTLMIISERSLSDAAHLGGLVFGVAAPLYGGPFVQRFGKNWQRRRVQRLVEADQTEREVVDQILQKVHEQGMNSLTRSERRILKKATEHQRQRDLELEKARRY